MKIFKKQSIKISIRLLVITEVPTPGYAGHNAAARQPVTMAGNSSKTATIKIDWSVPWKLSTTFSPFSLIRS